MYRIFLVLLLTIFLGLNAFADIKDSLRMEIRDGNKYIVHRVNKSETLTQLAERYGVNESQILSSNPLVSNKIFPGQILRIPLNEQKFGPQKIADVLPLTDSRMPLAQALPDPNQDEPKQVEYKMYVVASPQSVQHLAESFGVRAEDIIALNQLKNYRLKEGQKVKIPIDTQQGIVKAEPAPAPAPKPIPVVAKAPEKLPEPILVNANEARRIPVQTPEKKTEKPLVIPAEAKKQLVTNKPLPAIKPGPKINQDSMVMLVIKKQRKMIVLSSMDSEYINPRGISYRVFDERDSDPYFDPYASKMADANAIPIASMQQNKGAGNKNLSHTVKRGETLQSIAQKYKVSATDIINWNGLMNYRVRDGQELVINADRAAISPYVRTLVGNAKTKNEPHVISQNRSGLGKYDAGTKIPGVRMNQVEKGKFVYIINVENKMEHFAKVSGPLPAGTQEGIVILLDKETAAQLGIEKSLSHVDILVDLISTASNK